MQNIFSFAVYGCSVIFLIISILLSKMNYKHRFQDEYSFKNHFPFEMNYEGHFFDNLFGNVLLLFSCLFLIVFYVSFNGSHENGIAIFALIAGSFASAVNGFLFFVPLKNLKTHVALSTFSFAFSFMIAASGFLLNLFYYNQNHNLINLIGAIIAGLLTLIVIGLVMNPKLSLKIQGQEVKLENGESQMIRPKWITYGFTEWLIIFSIYINAIPFVLYIMSIM